MDTFNFLVTVILMIIAVQLNEPFIALGILVISILTSKEMSTIVMFIVATGVIYFAIGTKDDSVWLIVIFGLIVLSIVLGSKSSEPQGVDPGGLGGYGDMLGGMGGFG